MNKKFKGLMHSWIITDDSIKYGGIFKKTIHLNEIGDIEFSRAIPPKSDGEICLGHIRIFRLTRAENKGHISEFSGNVIWDDKGILISYRYEQQNAVLEVLSHIIENSKMNEHDRARTKTEICEEITGENARANAEYFANLTSPNSSNKEKDASVVGRAVAGGIIAGPAGAIVGALSAVDKNNKSKK